VIHKNIFITGASRGIGEALSYAYASPGVTLGLTAQCRLEELQEVAERCRSKGSKVITYVADVVDQVAIEGAAKKFLTEVGKIDLVIANAGIALTEDESFAASDIPFKVMQVNYFGVINTLLPFVQAMKSQKFGHLVAVSSIASYCSTQNSGAYSASKAAVNRWTEGLRLRLINDGISVSTLCLGFVDTEMNRAHKFWMPGLISASRAAELMKAAIQKRKRMIIIPFTARVIWTSFRIMPGYLYDLLLTWAKSRHPK